MVLTGMRLQTKISSPFMELSVTFLTEKHTVSMFLTTLFAEHLLNLSILYVTAAYTLFHLYGH